jgi:hypothetical protein
MPFAPASISAVPAINDFQPCIGAPGGSLPYQPKIKPEITMDFANMKREKKENLPKMEREVYDYKPLIDEAVKLKKDEVLQIPISKDHQVTGIQGALSRMEKSRKYRVCKRTIDGEKFALVQLAKGYK